MAVSDDSIAAAMREYLDTLVAHDVRNCTDYFQSLYENHPGSWSSAVRNIRYGLDHFQPGLVLDLGCGFGMQGYVFAKHGRDVLGVDLNHDWLEDARAAVKELGVDTIEFRVGDSTEEIKELSAGNVWMHRALGHIGYLPEFFRRVNRALDPGGAFVLMTSNVSSRRMIPGMRNGQHSVKRLTQLLNDAAFDVRDVEYHGYLTAFPLRYRPSNIDVLEPKLSKVPVVRAMGGSFSLAAFAR